MKTDALRSVQTGVQFSVLGPLTVTEGTATLNIGGPKQRTVLAMLISRAGSPVSADLLVDAVYGEGAGPRSRRTVQTFVSTLRGEVGEVIEKTGGGWRLVVDPERIDAGLFENLVGSAAEVAQKTPERAAQLLRDALALWNGHPYSDVEAHGHLDGEVSRLNGLRLSTHSSRIDADLASGRHGDLVGEIEALLVEHPYQEHFRAQHMTALYRAGRQQEALASYRQMRGLLADELGIDPSAELQDLELRILEQDPSLQETTTATIQRKAVLVADPGDPLEIARLSASRRDSVVARATEVVDAAVGVHPGAIVHSAGTATYALFDDISHAASAAEAVVLRLDGEGLRMAIDWGDVEVSDDGVTGPPVTRAARLVGVAHRGQVLLTAEAQQSLSAEGGPGLRFETLGSYTLPGLENTTAIYQLLVGDPPRKFSALATDRLPPPLPGARHRSVPGYELREPFGRGSVGDLYTAYQPSVGRQVLIEVIPRSVASSPDFIRRFEADVQRLWLLDHPNVNSIVDYWRDPEGAFVVYRWHRGGLLDVSEAVKRDELVAQIGSALAYAHSYGLAHGSVAPDRVLLDESGNGFLLGFPFASMSAPAGDYSEYIAPEDLDGSAPSVSSDVYALGMLALELGQGSRVDTDAPVLTDDPVLSRVLAEDPEHRFTSVGEFLAEFAPRRSAAPGTRYTETRNPYKGLAAFHESDAHDFFGRTELTGQLIERLADQSFLAVVGPSGSGKSSVVRAGLIPAVRQGRIPGSENWLITDMLPGSHPFLELRRALERVAVDMPVDVMNALASETPDALSDIRSVLPDGASLLLLVDQFEELFTMSPAPVAAAFVELLANASNSGRARVVITLRADFLDRPLAYSSFGRLLGDNMITIAAPSPEELVSAITTPAQRVGVMIDGALVGRIVAEVHDRPGALPLLQHTLTELFDARISDLIDVPIYEDLGGVSGSLAMRAESIYASFDPSRQASVRQSFLRLVSVLEGTAPTRSRVRVDRLSDLGSADLIESFTRSRLLVADTDPETRTPTVEIAHEALITHWPRLEGWIDSAREDLTLRRRLDEALREWEESGRDGSYLLSGGRLAQHQSWTAETTLTLTDIESEFLTLSEQRDQQQRSKRRRKRTAIVSGFAVAAVMATFFGLYGLQKAGEAEESADLAAEREQEAEDAAAQAESERQEAERQTKIAIGRELSASSAAVINEDPELAVMLALNGVDALGDDVRALAALRSALGSSRTLFYSPVAEDAGPKFGDISPDGSLVVISTDEADVEMYDLESGERLWLYEVPYEGTEDVWGAHPIFVNGGTEVAVTVQLVGVEPTDAGGAYVLSLNGELLRRFIGPSCGLGEAPGSIFDDSLFHTFELDPDFVAAYGCEPNENGQWIGHGSLLDVNTGERTPLGEAFNINADFREISAFDGSGSIQLVYIHTGGEEVPTTPQLRAIDRVTGAELANFDGVVADWQGAHALAVSWDGTTGAVGGGGGPENGAIRIFDMETGEVLSTLTGHPGGTNEIRFLDGRRLLVSTGVDGIVKWWDVEGGVLVSEIATGTGDNGRVRPSADELRFLVIGMDATTVVSLDSADFTEAEPIEVCGGEVDFNLTDGIVVKADSVLIRVICGNDEVDHLRVASYVYDYAGGEIVASIPDTDGQVGDISVDGGYLVAQSNVPPTDTTPPASGAVTLTDLTTLGQRTFDGMCAGNWDIGYLADDCGPSPEGPVSAWANDMDFSPDGSQVAMGAAFLTPGLIWSTGTGEVLASWVFNNGAFSRDGARFVSAGDLGSMELRETGDFGVLVSREVGVDLLPSDLNFASDGETIVGVVGADIYFYDAETLADLDRSIFGAHEGLIRDLKVSVDGSMIATAGQDGFVRIWDFETGDLVHEIAVDPTSRVQALDFINQDRHLLATTPTGPVIVYTLEAGELVDFARSRLLREFTSTECQLYFANGPCPSLEEMRAG